MQGDGRDPTALRISDFGTRTEVVSSRLTSASRLALAADQCLLTNGRMAYLRELIETAKGELDNVLGILPEVPPR